MASDDEYRLDREPIKSTHADSIDEAFERFAVRGEHLPRAVRYAIDHGGPPARGLDQQRMRMARDVFGAVVDAAFVGGPDNDRWLRDVFASLRPPLSKGARRLLVVRACEVRGDFEEAQALVRQADDAFDSMSDATLRELLDKVDDSPGGAKKFGSCMISAKLSLAVSAFGDKQRTGESPAHAEERIAQAFRSAQTRMNRKRKP
jgi:hypothetical protein